MTVTAKQAQRVLAKYGTPVRVRPLDALMQLLYEAYGNVEFLREKIREQNKMVLAGKQTREEVSAWVQLYNDERDRLQKYLLDAGKLGIDQQQVRLYQLQAQGIVAVLRRLVDELQLTPEQYQRAGKLVAAELRAWAAKNRPSSASPFDDADTDNNVVEMQRRASA